MSPLLTVQRLHIIQERWMHGSGVQSPHALSEALHTKGMHARAGGTCRQIVQVGTRVSRAPMATTSGRSTHGLPHALAALGTHQPAAATGLGGEGGHLRQLLAANWAAPGWGT